MRVIVSVVVLTVVLCVSSKPFVSLYLSLTSGSASTFFAVWRAELDETRQDPRDELAFQTQLNDYAQLLRQKGGGVTKAWKPSATPPEWAGE
ncbi:MAG TPA: hypothetical protein VMD79_05335 [Solirubrobacteraceae bacterium]|nr:hypothetical protein [Solirubrobacteraceae bacterium]